MTNGVDLFLKTKLQNCIQKGGMLLLFSPKKDFFKKLFLATKNFIVLSHDRYLTSSYAFQTTSESMINFHSDLREKLQTDAKKVALRFQNYQLYE